MVVAPAWTATVIIWMRKSRSVRVASSVENSTSSTIGAGEADGLGDLIERLRRG